MKHYPLRSNDIRESNEKLVLNLIFQTSGISQSQVVLRTGLKAPTVFRIFAKLERAGFIKPCTEDRVPDFPADAERKGRRPSFFCPEPTSGYAVGVDFSSLAAAVILVDFCNKVLYQESVEFERRPDLALVLARIEEMIARTLEKGAVAPEALLGIGIAAPGVVETVGGMVLEYKRIQGLSGFPLGSHFESIFGAPVYVHNNASVIASSAYHYGAARNEDSLLAVLVRSGVGGALVNHGNIFLNGTSTALEVGRTTIFSAPLDKSSTVTSDNATGHEGETRAEECFEADATPEDGPDVLEATIAEEPLLARLQAHFPVQTWADVDRELTGDQVWNVLDAERRSFGTTVRNLHHLLHPDAVLIISRFRVLSEFLGAAVRCVLPERRVIPVVYDPVQACYGATDMVFQEFFQVSQTAKDQTAKDQTAKDQTIKSGATPEPG